MKRFLNLGISLCILNFAGINKAEVESVDLSRSVVKIMAISPSGKQNMGSGVVIAHNKIATNCHVTRIARRAYIIKEDRLYAVLAQAAIPELDVCILETAPVTLPIASLVTPDSIKIGVDITISGYPYALGIRTMPGSIIALHPFAEDAIIEINSGFIHGASGGGVFILRTATVAVF